MQSGAEKPERLFIGVPISEDARQSILRSLPKNLPGKLVPAENWHFTLRFLGATPGATRDRIVQLLRAATCGAPFTVHFSSLGAFPRPNRARILWLGIDEGAERMIQLAAIAEATARVAGFVAESKPFKPHLTLSRIDPPLSVSALVGSKPRFSARMTVDCLILYRSRLGGGPARYEKVERIRLGR
ncbi:MAG TPA: RNA 2',3'-cyclic phosphodiesterase [Gemmatimonadaceae bacterium]|nr:RNA 2',3'-cyclic phosphodiesterase [Gemmatimonadaceae bacterium]